MCCFSLYCLWGVGYPKPCSIGYRGNCQRKGRENISHSYRRGLNEHSSTQQHIHPYYINRFVEYLILLNRRYTTVITIHQDISLISHMQQQPLLLRFLPEDTVNLDLRNNQIIQVGTIRDSPTPTCKALIISRPKIHPDTCISNASQIHTTFHNDIYTTLEAQLPSLWEFKVIYPAATKHLNKYKRKKKQLIKETPQDYLKRDMAEEVKHNQWVYNILEGKAEADRIIFREEGPQGFILIPDSEYVNGDTSLLHYLAIVNDRALMSLRDLRDKDVSLLQGIQMRMREVMSKLGLGAGYREYLHYPPTFYHLHVHFSTLEIEGPSVQVERCHDLQQVIYNLKLKSDYYRDATLNIIRDVAE